MLGISSERLSLAAQKWQFTLQADTRLGGTDGYLLKQQADGVQALLVKLHVTQYKGYYLGRLAKKAQDLFRMIQSLKQRLRVGKLI